jgi:hypothetical protein
MIYEKRAIKQAVYVITKKMNLSTISPALKRIGKAILLEQVVTHGCIKSRITYAVCPLIGKEVIGINLRPRCLKGKLM